MTSETEKLFHVHRAQQHETRTLHFDLSHLPKHGHFTLHVGGKRYPLREHTDATRAAAARQNLAVKHLPAHRVTHYVDELSLPADRVQMLFVVARRNAAAREKTLALVTHHVPTELRRSRLQARRREEIDRGLPRAPHPKLAMYGIQTPGGEEIDYDKLLHDATSVQGAFDAAQTLIMHHPEILCLDPKIYAIALDIVEYVPGLSDLAQSIHTQASSHDAGQSQSSWVNQKPLTAPNMADPVDFSVVVYTASTPTRATGTLSLSRTSGSVAPTKDTKVTVTITTGGAAGVATWTHSIDDGAPVQAGAAASADIGDGITVTLRDAPSGSGFVAGDRYAFIGSPHGWAWSDETRDKVAKAGLPGPLQHALRATKDKVELENWSYVIQPGTTSIGNPTQTQPPRMISRFSAPSPRHAGDVDAVGDAGPKLVVRDITPNCGFETSEASLDGGGSPTFKISYNNLWIRWLGVYAEFLDASRRPVAPAGWTSYLPSGSGEFETDTKKFLTLASARNTVLGIPLVNPTPTDLSFPWPSLADGSKPSAVRILGAGIGSTQWGEWDKICAAGGILTGMFNFALPMFFLAAGAKMTFSKSMDEEIKNELKALLPGIRQLIEGPVGYLMSTGSGVSTIFTALGNAAITVFLDLVPGLWEQLVEEIAADELLDATPFVGWVAYAIGVAADTALLIESTVEVLESPPVISVEVDLTLSVSVTVGPDPDSLDGKTWPADSDHYVAILQYSDGTSYEKQAALDPTKTSGPVTITFSPVPAGGNVKVVFGVYSSSDALCGTVSTPSFALPIDAPSATLPSVNIKQSLKPLTSTTSYELNQKLGYDSSSGHAWQAASKGAKAPEATAATLDSSNVGHHLAEVVGITLGQHTGALGYCWQAAGEGLNDCSSKSPLGLAYAFQSVAVTAGAGDRLLAGPTCGMTAQPYLVFDLLGPDSGEGKNYYFDPRDGGNHLRSVRVAPGVPFDMSTGQSFGRFNSQVDAIAVHPAGYIVGVSKANHNIQILKALDAPVADAKVLSAVVKAGLGSRAGLLHSPVAVTCTADGRILILEDRYEHMPERIQALDVKGNPVSCFAGSTTSQMSLRKEDVACTYLDMAVESKGYIYVLKILGAPATAKAGEYALDIYEPNGTWLTQTKGITAGKIAVSLFRDLFTLNYEFFQGPDGRTEPSVAWWLPRS